MEKTPGHQGENSTGGKTENMQVLYCRNVAFSMNFTEMELLARQFGKVKRIRLKEAEDETTLDAYIVYECTTAAEKAHAALNGHKVNETILKTKLFDINNLKDDPSDYYPEEYTPVIERKSPVPVWFVAHYKEGRENYLRASESLNKALNGIPSNNMKRYGRSILIKAKNKMQSKLLQNFKPSENSVIGSVSMHKSFNFSKGVIYSKDLYELTDYEILERSPPNVYEVKKLRGTNNVILLNFSTEYLPDYVNFGDYVRVRVRRFKPNPKQCRNCFEYGHVSDNCLQMQRCPRCSDTHDENIFCNNELFCFLCDANHSPASKECLRRKFEREVVETADVERISIGSAKRQIMGANRNENSTYANVIKKMKLPKHRETVERSSNENSKITAKSVITSPSTLSPSTLNEGASKSSAPNAASSSGVQPNKQVKDKNKNDHDVDGFKHPPNHKRTRQSSPRQSGIQTSNRFEVLDPFSPLITDQPLKKIALSASCSDKHTLVDSERSATSPSEERLRKVPGTNRPTRLNRPDGSTRNSPSLPRNGKSGIPAPKTK